MTKPLFFWDTETYRFRPGEMSPRPVCLSWKLGDETGLDHLNRNISTDGWFIIEDALEQASQGNLVMVGHHLAYDMCCIGAERPDLLPLIFAAYDADGVTDTEVRQKLIDIQEGEYRGFWHDKAGKAHKISYHLDFTFKRHTGMELPKPQEVRIGYGELWDKPLEEWTDEERGYAQDDAIAVQVVYDGQEALNCESLVDQFRQSRASFALQLASNWGMRTDRVAVEELYNKCKDEVERMTKEMVEAGFVRENGTRDMKRLMEHMQKVYPMGPKTETGRVCLDEDACKNSKDPTMLTYAAFVKEQNTLAKDIPMLVAGIVYPIHTRFEELVETGRTSSSSPNIQNIKRTQGFRECFAPRPGHLFCACDFGKAELHALAQVCLLKFQFSRLAEALNAGVDPHLKLAASFLGITYEEALERKNDTEVEKARQSAKALNFGIPGGLGVEKFREFAKNEYGVEMTEAEAKKGKAQYLTQWPEMYYYFKWVGDLCKEGGADMLQVGSGRIRGNCGYTQSCNSMFQGLCADFAKAALYAVAKEEYAVPESPLYGCRTVNFLHDEIIMEVPDDVDLADAAAKRLKDVMEEAARPWTSDVPVKCSPTLMRRWTKAAKSVFDNEGRLIPWEDRK